MNSLKQSAIAKFVAKFLGRRLGVDDDTGKINDDQKNEVSDTRVTA